MKLSEYIRNNILILDGGMGTMLQSAGLKPGELPERWNILCPEKVKAVHRAYFDAGSNAVLTNTFGANPLKYDPGELRRVVQASVRLARAAADESVSPKVKFVGLDIGPCGRLLRPFGDIGFEEAVKLFSEIIKHGISGEEKPDFIAIETMSDSYETKAALLSAKENCELPVFVTNTYGLDGKLMTGAGPEAVIALLCGMGADAAGVNCSYGPKELKGVIEKYLELSPVPVIVKPNAGAPTPANGKSVYDLDPESFASEMAEFVKGGVQIAGGCCGTEPRYIKKLVEKISGDMDLNRRFSPGKNSGGTVVSSFSHTVSFGSAPVIIGERINPTGKKKIKQALLEGDHTVILDEALAQEKAGADILDVNAGLTGIRESEELPLLIEEIQAVTALPLQIDTSSKEALERSLRLYNGKALINSVNGKRESMKAVFPLVKKYGGVVVGLTLDEDGIPESAEGRMMIARKIIGEAAKYGIDRKDIIIDPLCLTVSASSESAVTTLRSVAMIKKRLGVNTLLGVSNVSFGLPMRELVNSTFLLMALEAGLSAAIADPLSASVKETLTTYKLLAGLDKGCMEYIAYAKELSKKTAAFREASDGKAPQSASDGNSPGGEAAPDGGANKGGTANPAEEAYISEPLRIKEELKGAVCRGLKEKAAKLSEMLLEHIEPMELVDQVIIPALDEVGTGFEEKRIYLPQLLMSAEAAGTALLKVKNAVISSGGGTGKERRKGPVVLATVKGDIHDIGKGIVRLLLENYGFDVIDLGKDVAPGKIAEAVKKSGAPIAGLSALMTTTVPSMEETIKLLRKEAPDVRIVVGGAVLTRKYAEEIGADRYAADAMETVRYAETVIE